MPAADAKKTVPDIRIHVAKDAPVRADGEFVLYWMIANRRASWNFALDRAVEHAVALSKPLVVLEALRVGYPWASDRLHRFVLDGMADNRAAFADAPVLYVPYVEPTVGAGSGLMEALTKRAAVVVTDEFPCFFLPRMVAAAAARSPVRVETVDSNGLLPLRAATKTHPSAYAFRRFLQKTLPAHLADVPAATPFDGVTLPKITALPADIAARWPAANEAVLRGETLASLPIDHTVGVVAERGGTVAARAQWERFLRAGLPLYADDRSHPDIDASSGLSPWLHFGHISAHEVFESLTEWEDWLPEKLGTRLSGQRDGFWNMSRGAESFLDELITWREVGYVECFLNPAYDKYESLPGWAQATLDAAATDERKWTYDLEAFERGETHDPVWNAAQHQLRREGRVQNYMRMLWGKKILEWSASPQEALAIMVELNNKYALDGRNPNSYSGIFWTLGRYDRPWAPKRPVFGTIRWMSSDNTVKKLKAKQYLARFARP